MFVVVLFGISFVKVFTLMLKKGTFLAEKLIYRAFHKYVFMELNRPRPKVFWAVWILKELFQGRIKIRAIDWRNERVGFATSVNNFYIHNFSVNKLFSLSCEKFMKW